MPLTIPDGDLIRKDPADIKTYVFDWDAAHLATGVTISTSTFTLTTLRPTGDTALTKDQPSILSGSRKTQIRLTGGTLGGYYKLDNTIVTNESPAQTIERSVFITVEQR